MKKSIVTNLKRGVVLGVLGAMLVTGSVSAASQNKVTFSRKYIAADKLKKVATGKVGSKAEYATTKVTERVALAIPDDMYPDMFFVHKNESTGKYVTVGRWIKGIGGTINSAYLTNQNVKENTKLTTYGKTVAITYDGVKIIEQGIYGYVKY